LMRYHGCPPDLSQVSAQRMGANLGRLPHL
jgi:hypothetical protein